MRRRVAGGRRCNWGHSLGAAIRTAQAFRHHERMDRSVAWRAALLQGVFVGVVAVVLALALPRSFFEDWGRLAGPGAWALCAVAVALMLRLPAPGVLVGAALGGLPMLAGVAIGIHWIGAPLGLAIFGWWCGRLAAGDRVRGPGGRRTRAEATT